MDALPVAQPQFSNTEGLVGWLGFNGTFSTNRLYHATEVENISHRASGQQKHHAIKQ